MADKEHILIEELLNNPEVKDVLENTNHELIERRNFKPRVCDVFLNAYTALSSDGSFCFDIHPEARKKLPDIIDNKVQVVRSAPREDNEKAEAFSEKRTIGIVFSGGPAPGGHNVIAGLYDAAKKANPETRIYGFLLGPDGIIQNEAVVLTDELVDKYRNLGGFSMIKTGRTKIDSVEKMQFSRQTCRDLGLNALVVVGGDDSNTNAAFLAQELYNDGIQVIGVPKTIDGDIQVTDASGRILCAMSFGFHTAARAFAKNISDLCIDSSSDVKYWHICKVMGRVASHLAQEVALQTHANMTFIGEDLADYVDFERIRKADDLGVVDYTAYGMTLRHLSRVICDGIIRRAAAGKNYGVLVIPEGILEFINEIQVFIIKLNTIIAEYNETHDNDFHTDFPTLEDKLTYLRRLERRSREGKSIPIWNSRDDDLFNDIPDFFQEGLLMERDSHGNFQFSQVETDKIIMGLVKDYLKILRDQGLYKIGIEPNWYTRKMKSEGLDPEIYGEILFNNFGGNDLLMFNDKIMSQKTLKQTLVRSGLLNGEGVVPDAVKEVYKKSVPNFKVQSHFYGYDGRGSDPTAFDCNYTYNLGQTVFSLIAGGATGQMAAIRNLEKSFEEWMPLGIPIAPLMHLEERKGRLALVLEKTIVSVDSPAFRVLKSMREEWLAARPGEDSFRRPGPIRFTGTGEEDRPLTLILNSLAERGDGC